MSAFDEDFLPDSLKRLREALLSRGFVRTGSGSGGRCVGDGWIEFGREGFGVEFLREAAEWFVSVSVGGSGWYAPLIWRQVLDPLGTTDVVDTIDQQAALLGECLDALLRSPVAEIKESIETMRREVMNAEAARQGIPLPFDFDGRSVRAALEAVGVDPCKYAILEDPADGQHCVEQRDSGFAVFLLQNGVRTKEQRFASESAAYRCLFTMLTGKPLRR